MGNIGEYLTRMLDLKGWTPTELAKRTGLANGYITRLCKSKSANLTVDSMKKLAMALGVNPHEIFAIAAGVPADEAAPVNVGRLFHLMGRLVDDSGGVDLLCQVLDTPPDQRQVVLDYLAHNGEAPP
jgi:transcriptional regulator with XRE-family HTH domain